MQSVWASGNLGRAKRVILDALNLPRDPKSYCAHVSTDTWHTIVERWGLPRKIREVVLEDVRPVSNTHGREFRSAVVFTHLNDLFVPVLVEAYEQGTHRARASRILRVYGYLATDLVVYSLGGLKEHPSQHEEYAELLEMSEDITSSRIPPELLT